MSLERLNAELARSLNGSLADLGYGAPAGKPMRSTKQQSTGPKQEGVQHERNAHGRRESKPSPGSQDTARVRGAGKTENVWTGSTPSSHLDHLWEEVGRSKIVTGKTRETKKNNGEREHPSPFVANTSTNVTDPSNDDSIAREKFTGSDGNMYQTTPIYEKNPMDFFGSPIDGGVSTFETTTAPQGMNDIGLGDSIGLFDAVEEQRYADDLDQLDTFLEASTGVTSSEQVDDIGLFDVPPTHPGAGKPSETGFSTSAERNDAPAYEDVYPEADDDVSTNSKQAPSCPPASKASSASHLRVESYPGEGLEDSPPPYYEAVHAAHRQTSAARGSQSGRHAEPAMFQGNRSKTRNEKMKSAISAVKKLSLRVKNEAEKRLEKHVKAWKGMGKHSSTQDEEWVSAMVAELQTLSAKDRQAALMAMDEVDRALVLKRMTCDVQSTNTGPSHTQMEQRRRTKEKQTSRNISSRPLPTGQPAESSNAPDIQGSSGTRISSASGRQEKDQAKMGGVPEESRVDFCDVERLDILFRQEETILHPTNCMASKSSFQNSPANVTSREELRAQREARVQARMKEKLLEKKEREKEEKEKQKARQRASENMGNELKAWSQRSRGNIRALLGSLDKVLWESCGWNAVNMMELVDASSVKKVYRKAITVVHPDKVKQRGATAEQEYIADVVFDSLKEAYGKFEAGELRGGSPSYQPVFM